MRACLPHFELTAPETLRDALSQVAQGSKPFAGGTDLMVLLEAGKLDHRRYVSLWHFAELRGIEVRRESVTLGALTTYTQIQRHATLRAEFPLLCRAAEETGGVATQNRGTLGGNIANASPAADSPPALLVYDAELELMSHQGSRWVSYRGFHTGYKQMIMQPQEIISRIRLPRHTAEWRQYYRKVGTRRAQAISKVVMAAAANFENGRVADARIALGSVAPTVLRCEKTEALLRGQRPDGELLRAAQAQLAREIAPIDDMRSTARYRTRVAQNLLAEFLEQHSR
jgi:CO/xanthine dehydrogenase FAD-binding subunit